MPRSTWPADAIARLGRSLQRWDICPTCGQPAARHVWSLGDGSEELRCPGDAIAVALVPTSKAEYLTRIAEEDRLAAELEAKRRENRRTAEQLSRRRAPADVEKAPAAPALDVDAKRAYFEE